MSAAFTVLLLALGGHYLVRMIDYALGFRRVVEHDRPSRSRPTSSISVLIAARDEADAIEACLTSVLACDYPPERREIIVVDDGSTDATREIVRRLARQARRVAVPAGVESDEGPASPVRLLANPGIGKKAALAHGVAAATGELILTTDADCLVPPTWLRSMAATFDGETGFVSGPVLYPATGTVGRRIQALEFLALVAIGAGAIGAGRPNMCNGANAAYRRSVFDTVAGYGGIDHLTSGDDELLMQRIAYDSPYGVRFCADPHAAVLTRPAPDPASFFRQRRRWASKGAFYPHRPLVRTIAAFYLFYLILLGGLLVLPWAPGLAVVVGAGFALKLAGDLPLTIAAARHFDRVRLLAVLPLLVLLHLPYVVILGAAGLWGGFTWKGRTVSR